MRVLTAWVFWLLGQVDAAVSQIAAALERADTLEHVHTRAYAWYYAAVLHALRGEAAIAQGYAERCLATSEQYGFGHWIRLARAVGGVCASMLDHSAGRLTEVKAALDEHQCAGYQIGMTVQLALLGGAHLFRNEPEAALELIEQGLSIVGHNSERLFEAELYRLKARALLMRGAPDSDTESLLSEALRTARRQQARSLELRAATDLARLWMKHGRRMEARDVLDSIYSRFSEGFGTQNLKEANAV
jgi:predicted ATPase